MLLVLGPILAILGLTGFLYLRATNHMPTPAQTIYLDPIVQSSNFYDRTGAALLYSVQDPLGDERKWVTIEDMPVYVLDATLQMEDPNFLETGGFDFVRTVNRLWLYSLDSPLRRDTSIAGRLATNTLVPMARGSGLDDNLLHIAFTAEVNRRYSPRRVLEWYLNTAYYGKDAYGIDAAARVYFGKPTSELTLDEAAMLATIPLAPQFNPLDNDQAARDRQLNLLRQMRANGRISQAEFDIAGSAYTSVRTDIAQLPYAAHEFALYAREQAEDILNWVGYDGARLISRGGLHITTTLDLDLYYQSECTVRAHLAQLHAQSTTGIFTLSGQDCLGAAYLDDIFGVDSTALPDEGVMVILDVRTGEIQAMVGDATAYAYQPGTTLHPFVYLSGFRNGQFTPARMVLDIPIQFPGPTEGSIYTPRDADGRYRGPINLRDAMVSGLTVPAAFVANSEGLTGIITDAHVMGLNSLSSVDRYDLSLVERGGDVSVLDMSYAYSVFASMGYRQGVDTEPLGQNYRDRDPVSILRIEDAEGHVLWEYNEELIASSRTPVVSSEFSYLVNDILSDSTTRRRVLNIDDSVFNIARPSAVVNGLSGDASESWTIGYTPQLVVAVHLSRSDAGIMSFDNYGLQASAPIWQAVMRLAHDRYHYAPASWSRPDGIIAKVVCEKSGMIPPPESDCPRRTEIFHPQVLPTQEDIYWQTVEVNSQTGQRVSISTPSHLIVEQVYFVPPNEALDWWTSNGQPLPPTEYDYLSLPEALGSVEIFVPQDLAYVRAEVDIRGVMDTEGMKSFQVRYGQGFRPTQWFAIGGKQTAFFEGRSLAIWDTIGLDGPYTIELSVQYENGSIDAAAVNVTVDNIPPVITLKAGEEGASIIRWPTQAELRLIAEADDNLAVDRVEFYRNGVLIGDIGEAPFELVLPIDGTGIEVFTASVFDEAGNQASSEIELEVIRG
jgi:membrane peptidoglycan carboxypeptidase